MNIVKKYIEKIQLASTCSSVIEIFFFYLNHVKNIKISNNSVHASLDKINVYTKA